MTEWNEVFLRVNKEDGFNENWISLTMLCVKIVSYSILVNGEPKGLIYPTREIWQGDHLSPFLFLLCTEGLHGLIMHAAIVGVIKGFALCKRSLELIHLLFVDGSLLFCRVMPEEYNKIMDLLTIYENASGQKVNRSKIAIFFSKSIPKDTKDIIKGILGLQEIHQYEKYLSLPFLVSRGKKARFNYIKERV